MTDEQKKDAPLPSLGELFKAGAENEPTPDLARAEIVRELMGKKNLNRVTQVSNFDIAMLSSGKGVNFKAESKVYDAFEAAFLELRVSHERLGRKEVVDISRNQEPAESMRKPFWKAFI